MEQHEFDTCARVLEYMLKQMKENEPYAHEPIGAIETTLEQMGEAEDYKYE
jgi:hypothetical protein